MNDTMQLRDIANALRRTWWIPVALIVVGVILGVTASANVPPLYRSRATLLVGPTNGAVIQSSTVRASEDLASFYADMARRQIILEPVARRLERAESWFQLRDQVSAVAPPENLRLVSVTVTANSQKRADSIANQVVDGLVSLSPPAPEGNSQAFINGQADILQKNIDERERRIRSLEAQAKATTDPYLKSTLHRQADRMRSRITDWQRVYVELVSAEPTSDAGALQVIDEANPVTDAARAGAPKQAFLGGLVGAALGALVVWLLHRRWTGRRRTVGAVEEGTTATEMEGWNTAEDGHTSDTYPPPAVSLARGSDIPTVPKYGNEGREAPSSSSSRGYGRVPKSSTRVAGTRTGNGGGGFWPRELRDE